MSQERQWKPWSNHSFRRRIWLTAGLVSLVCGSMWVEAGPARKQCPPSKATSRPAPGCKPVMPPPRKRVAVVPLRNRNMLGTKLTTCSRSPLTGYFRDGYCHTGPSDRGVHVVCATMTKAFLQYTKAKGNDLSTPAPRWNFPGLKPGDKWCLCAVRWLEAQRAGKAPLVVPSATHHKALRIVKRTTLLTHQQPTKPPKPAQQPQRTKQPKP